jgi:hypothetical protein
LLVLLPPSPLLPLHPSRPLRPSSLSLMAMLLPPPLSSSDDGVDDDVDVDDSMRGGFVVRMVGLFSCPLRAQKKNITKGEKSGKYNV